MVKTRSQMKKEIEDEMQGHVGLRAIEVVNLNTKVGHMDAQLTNIAYYFYILTSFVVDIQTIIH